jgi:hypothetical protein
MRLEQFEFTNDYRGPAARLTWRRHDITIADWPVTLFEMLEQDVLGPQAKAEAVRLQEEWQYLRAGCGHWVHRDHRALCRVDGKIECLACGHKHAGRAGW